MADEYSCCWSDLRCLYHQGYEAGLVVGRGDGVDPADIDAQRQAGWPDFHPEDHCRPRHRGHHMTLDQLPLVAPAPVRVIATGRAETNRLLTEWAHYLGPCDRPFGQDHWLLVVDDRPVSLAVTASTVSATVSADDGRTWPRTAVVELARLCTAPHQQWATRVMLRLWRGTLARRWAHWPATLAVAYSLNDRHEGRIYRFDGWARLRSTSGKDAGANSTWTKPRPDGHPATGRKTLWGYQLEATA